MSNFKTYDLEYNIKKVKGEYAEWKSIFAKQIKGLLSRVHKEKNSHNSTIKINLL